MADIDDSIEDTPFRCLLCFQPYDCPRELPCLHTFCRRCFDSFTQTELTTNRTFPCPICEKPTPLSCPKSPVSTWASFLPHGQTHRPSSLVTQAGDDGVVCEGCRRDDENTRATHWCRHCVEALCSSCKIAHRRNKKTNDHKVVEISAVRNPGSSVLPISVPERCPQHPGKTLEVYCIDHHTLCCILCLAVSHRQCSHVRSIEDVSREPMSTCDDTWIRIEAESKVLLQKYEEAISSLDLDKENAIASMIAKLDAVRKKIDELQMKFDEDVKAVRDENKQYLLHHKRNAEQFHTNVTNTRLLMSMVEGHMTSRQAFIARDQASVQLTGHYQRLTHRLLQGHNMYKLELEVDDFVDKMNSISAVGRVKVIPSVSDTTKQAVTSIGTTLESIRKSHALSSFADSMSSSDMLGSLTRGKLLVRKIEPKPEMKTVESHLVKSVQSKNLGGKQVILLTGGAFVGEKWLVMADCNNKRVLLFDESYTYIKQYAIDGCPTDVVKGSKKSELYIAVFNKEILRCSLASGHLDVIARTGCPTLTCSIDLLDEKLIVVTSDSVKVLEDDGQEVNSVQIPTTGSTCIGACSQRHMYYHRDHNSVVGRALDGREQTRYTHPHLRDPVGLCSDKYGHMFVCGYQSGNVHQMAPDGITGRILLKKLDQIKHPWAVIVHQSKCEFVVTSCKETVAFEVYQIVPNK